MDDDNKSGVDQLTRETPQYSNNEGKSKDIKVVVKTKL